MAARVRHDNRADLIVVSHLLGECTAMITLQQLQVGYGQQPVTAPLTGCFARGSLTAVIGANGAGKSTLLKTLAGLQPALGGKIVFGDKKIPRMAYLPQQAELDRQFPIIVFDVVAMGCWPQSGMFGGLNRQSVQRIKQALDTVGMLDMARCPVGVLSGGQLQRVLFARLLVQQAPLLLLDEPFTGIDNQTLCLLLNVIQQLHQEGRTIIAVLHDMSMVAQHFPRVLQLTAEYCRWDESKRLFAECAEAGRNLSNQNNLSVEAQP